jgi:hypothetical protein
VLLPAFFVGTVAIVLAVVALDRIDSAVGDAGAFALVLVCAGLLMNAIRRLLDEQTPPGDDQPDRPGENSRRSG